MTDLSDVTTDEMFEELKKRNDAVILAAWQFLGADRRVAIYTNWHGPKVILAGLARQIDRELELQWQLEEGMVAAAEEDEDEEDDQR